MLHNDSSEPEEYHAEGDVSASASDSESSSLDPVVPEAIQQDTPPVAEPAAPIAISVTNLSLLVTRGRQQRLLLHGLSFNVQKGHFVAVVGSSGCGKSTLIKTLSGELKPTRGKILLGGHPVADLHDAFPLSIGYLPQFGTFHRSLTVWETLSATLSLRLPRSVPSETRQKWLDHLVRLARLEKILHQPISTLSGGQIRRLALVEELIGDPPFLLLDELTSGLDAFADREMMLWLRHLAHNYGKTIILVTHATEQLGLCDSVVFLHQGILVQYAPISEILASHEVGSVADLFGLYHNHTRTLPRPKSVTPEPIPPQSLKTARPPMGLFQFPAVLLRHFSLLARDLTQLGLHFTLLVSFPILVAVFAQNGLPQVTQLTLHLQDNVIQSLADQLTHLSETIKAASLISGMTLFQVILLTLLGSSNGAREIARERNVLVKERRAGLSPIAYVATKFLHILLLSTLQALWMAWFVKTSCGFPGSLWQQFGVLELTTLAMSTFCLAISAASGSAERASLLCIYLVGVQLPLSGATLALPDYLANTCRPFIAAYWGWSGYLKTLESTPYYDTVRESRTTSIAEYSTCMYVLTAHVIVGLLLTWWFVRSAKQNLSSD